MPCSNRFVPSSIAAAITLMMMMMMMITTSVDGTQTPIDVSVCNGSTCAQPQSVAIDPTNGDLYVADTYNNRVLRYGRASSLNSASVPVGVLGQPDLLGKSPGLSASGMHRPFGLFVDADGTLWVADTANNRVLRFDDAAQKASGASADGVLGQPNFTSNAAPPAGPSSMNTPYCLTVGGDGTLWVSDNQNGRVIRFDAARSKPDGSPADGVLGKPALSGYPLVPGYTARDLFTPTGVVSSPEGALFVSDSSNNRVVSALVRGRRCFYRCRCRFYRRCGA